ncbi:hypothetical protein N7533_012508 [Penicillium manginii]|uniref:uncharacterized protein n=1 Tax=Penicillium manginii TaxID=203109 RepID=UPI0025483F64|nr:uncharacterized protein N7533_012508 [Penicillium manginii]KAJ5739724.1 hypothetical protein N7533_012508 [Penicillium manginii]
MASHHITSNFGNYNSGIQADKLEVGGDINFHVSEGKTEDDRNQECLRDLQALLVTDPRDDITRIKRVKGGLLKEAYCWVLDNADYQQWRDDLNNRLLWVKGDPGKGKTMLLCGLIDELTSSTSDTTLFSYFFCEASDTARNGALAVLRGLIYLLVIGQPSLVFHVRTRYDQRGSQLFSDGNAWDALSNIFCNILRDPNLKGAFVIVDALDECIEDQRLLLDLICQISSVHPQVKWIVSSRNEPEIEDQLFSATEMRLSLELNEQSVWDAVAVFIRYRVQKLAAKKGYNDDLQDAVLNHLLSNSQGTFLWVSLVCTELQSKAAWKARSLLNTFPPGLTPLYASMMNRLCRSEDSELCKQILRTMLLVHRPITLDEFPTLVDLPEDIGDEHEFFEQIIGGCYSFLVLRQRTIFFVHLSAKDFLMVHRPNDLFDVGIENEHYSIFQRSLQALQRLKYDIYRLKIPSLPINENDGMGDNRTETLLGQKVDDAIRFTRQHHFAIEKWPLQVYCSSLLFTPTQSKTRLQHQSQIPKWILGVHGMDIDWDSCIFTLQGHGEGVNSIAWSQDGLYVASGSTDKTVKLWDTSTGQCISSIYGHEEGITSIAWSPDGTRLASGSSDGAIKIWDTATRECVAFSKETSAIECVTWLQNQNRLATWSVKKNFMICDPSPERPLCDPDSGLCTCPSFCAYNLDASFSWTEDMIRVARWERDESILISDPVTDESMFTLMPVNRRIWNKLSSLYLSKDGTRLAIKETDSRISIWDTRAGDLLHVLHKPGGNLTDIIWSYDNGGLATIGLNEGLRIWDVTTETCLSIHTGHTGFVRSLAWSRDGAWLAGSSEYLVRIWNSSSGKCTSTLKGHTEDINSVEWSPDGTKIASGSNDTNVKIWDATRPSAPTLQQHGDSVNVISWSPDRARLISGSDDCEVRIWDTASGDCTLILEAKNWALSVAEWSHKSDYIATTFTYSRWRHKIAKDRSPLCDGIATRKHMSEWRHKGQQVDSDGWNCDAWVWCPDTGRFEFCIDAKGGPITAIAWSGDDSRLAASSWGSSIQVWGISNRQCIWSFDFAHCNKHMSSVSWSPDESRIATGWEGNTIKVLDLAMKQIICILQHPGDDSNILSTTWSHDGHRLASGSTDNTVRIWDTVSVQCITGFHVPSPRNLQFSPFNSNDLDTPIGTFKLDAIVSASSSSHSLNISPAQPFYGSRGEWITFGGRNVIWVPSAYRPSAWARSGLSLAIGTCLGQVLILHFQENGGPLFTKDLLDCVPDCRVLQDDVTGGSTDQRRCHQAFRVTKYEEQKDPYRQSVVEAFNQATLGNPAYIRWWNNTRSDVLWIVADSGRGKSGFARSIVEDYIPTSSPTVTVCYFFFEESDEQNNLASALCAILHQLFDQRPHLIHHASSTWENNGKRIRRKVDELWEILMAAAFSDVSLKIICVIDALNECRQDDQGRLITKLKHFHDNSLFFTKGTWLKFLVTSRSCGHIQDQYQVIKESFPLIDFQDKRNDEDDRGEEGEGGRSILSPQQGHSGAVNLQG